MDEDYDVIIGTRWEREEEGGWRGRRCGLDDWREACGNYAEELGEWLSCH